MAAGCLDQPMGTMLCQDPKQQCDCQDNRDRGGVVVRWRIADAAIGRLLDRGMCCCNPDPSTSSLIRQQCGNIGSSQCADSPGWLVRNVQLHIRSVDADEPRDCTVIAPCTDGELTTQYCFPPGVYDLQLRADIETVSKQFSQFICSNTQTLSPPTVRRTIKAGQAVNLDGIVLGVNAPPIIMVPKDGGVTD